MSYKRDKAKKKAKKIIKEWILDFENTPQEILDYLGEQATDSDLESELRYVAKNGFPPQPFQVLSIIQHAYSDTEEAHAMAAVLAEAAGLEFHKEPVDMISVEKAQLRECLKAIYANWEFGEFETGLVIDRKT